MKFYGKRWVGFCLNTWKRFFLEVSFKTNIKSIDSSKNRYKGFSNSTSFERSVCFHVTITENFDWFQYFNFETDFLENETFFEKLKCRFLVETTKNESTLFPYKTNVRTNRMVSIKWTCHKEQSFASNFTFLKILFHFKKFL